MFVMLPTLLLSFSISRLVLAAASAEADGSRKGSQQRVQLSSPPCIVGRNAFELAVFHAAASFVCSLRKSIVQADTLRKEASLSAGASAAAQPEKGLNEALKSEAASLNSDTKLLGNFEEQQQLKTWLGSINYAFVLLSWCFS